jgi:UDP-N-acetyl-D-glucosamine dehydrogenase
MPEYVSDKVAGLLNGDRLAVNGARVLVLGVAYKADVGDMRESPALDVIRSLADKGAEISYHDPHVGEFELEGCTYKSSDLTQELLQTADLTVILTGHSAIDYARVVECSRRVFDTRNATSGVESGREKIHKL